MQATGHPNFTNDQKGQGSLNSEFILSCVMAWRYHSDNDLGYDTVPPNRPLVKLFDDYQGLDLILKDGSCEGECVHLNRILSLSKGF